MLFSSPVKELAQAPFSLPLIMPYFLQKGKFFRGFGIMTAFHFSFIRKWDGQVGYFAACLNTFSKRKKLSR
jgi:hypothetical protein